MDHVLTITQRPVQPRPEGLAKRWQYVGPCRRYCSPWRARRVASFGDTVRQIQIQVFYTIGSDVYPELAPTAIRSFLTYFLIGRHLFSEIICCLEK